MLCRRDLSARHLGSLFFVILVGKRNVFCFCLRRETLRLRRKFKSKTYKFTNVWITKKILMKMSIDLRSLTHCNVFYSEEKQILVSTNSS